MNLFFLLVFIGFTSLIVIYGLALLDNTQIKDRGPRCHGLKD